MHETSNLFFFFKKKKKKKGLLHLFPASNWCSPISVITCLKSRSFPKQITANFNHTPALIPNLTWHPDKSQDVVYHTSSPFSFSKEQAISTATHVLRWERLIEEVSFLSFRWVVFLTIGHVPLEPHHSSYGSSVWPTFIDWKSQIFVVHVFFHL